MDVVADLERLFGVQDLAGLESLLDRLTGVSRAEAAAWVAASTAWCDDLVDRLLAVNPRPASYDAHPAHRVRWMEGVSAVALLDAATAAARVPWILLHGPQARGRAVVRGNQGLAALQRRLNGAHPAWVDEVVVCALAEVGGIGNPQWEAALSRTIQHHDLDSTWASHRHTMATRSLAERLASTKRPLAVFRHLSASGAWGSRGLDLGPAVVRDMLDAGTLSRAEVRDALLDGLRCDLTVTAQRQAAAVLADLDLTPDEVAGGVPVLLGLVADRHVSVGLVALPLALAIAGSDELAEVAWVVASRSQKRLRQIVLDATTSQVGLARWGAAATSRAVGALHAVTSASTAGADLAAAWDRAPAPREVDQPATWRGTRDLTWPAVLRRSFTVYTTEERWAVDRTLEEMLRGRFDAEAFVAGIRGVAVRGDLLVPRLTRMLDDLFLAGGLTAAWEPALQLADVVAARRLSGLEALLRMLTGYAAAAPVGELQPALADLVLARSASKARAEARRLGAVLGRATEAELLARLDSARREPVAAPIGLWWVDAHPDPVGRRIDHRFDATDAGQRALLVDRLEVDGQSAYGRLGHGGEDWSETGRLVADVLRCVTVLGEPMTRDLLGGLEPRLELPGSGGFLGRVPSTVPGPVTAAVDLWARGGLTPATYPRLWAAEIEDAPDGPPRGGSGPLWDVAGPLEFRLRLDRSLASDRPVLPPALGHPWTRLLLHHTAECLLLAARRAEPLSTPTYVDGTLDLVDLLDRIPGAPVGPLDLLLALHRLRPVPSDADLSALEDLGDLTTVPDLSGPDPLSVGDVVRTWVRAGGLPPLRSEVVDGHWVHHGVAPVLWTRCVSAPDGLADHASVGAGGGAALRVTPTWPGVAVTRAHEQHPAGERELTALLTLSGHGSASLDRVVSGLFCSDVLREQALPVVARRLTVERADPAVCARIAVTQLRAGVLSLARSVPVIASLFQAGGLRFWWPVALALVAEGASTPRKPAGLADLLALLVETAGEVPDADVPDEVVALAAQRGSTRSHVEARRLRDAIGANARPDA